MGGQAGWFATELNKGALLRLLSPHAQHDIVSNLAKRPDATHAQVELLLAALAQVESRGRAKPSRDDVDLMLAEAQRFLESSDGEMGPLTAGLRMLKGLRPAWLAVPIYAELLAPFSEACREALGHAPQDLLAMAATLEQAAPGHHPLPNTLPSQLFDELSIRLDEIVGPEDLHNRAWVQIDDSYSYCLRYKAVEATYRAINRILAEGDRHFFRKRGSALEAFVAHSIKEIAPSWTMIQGHHLAGHEKDILCWDDDSGLAIECKSLRLRPRSTGWSKLNLDSDVEAIRQGLSQVQGSIEALRRGTSTDEGQEIPSRSRVLGIVVSDEQFAPFIRAGIDRLPANGSGDSWHGKDTWVCSAIDLRYILSKAGSVSVLLHYLTHYRQNVWLRSDDESEAWSAYGLADTHLMATAGVRLTIKEHDWGREQALGPASFRPQWLNRAPLVRQFDERRSSSKGLRVVQQDLDRAVREARREMKKRQDGTDEVVDEATIEALAKMIEDRDTHSEMARPHHL